MASRFPLISLDSFRRELSLRPELKDLVEHVTPHYAIHWKEIGILIGVPVGEIQAIELGHPTMPKVCCNEMFTKWLECDAYASWDKVFIAIDSPAVKKPIISTMPHSGIFLSVDAYKKQKLSSILSLAVISLKAQYRNQSPPCADDLPELPVLKYVQLALVNKRPIKNEPQYLDDFTKHSLLRERDVIHNTKEKLHGIEEIFYYNSKPCPSRILIEGGPGVGKTTLVYKICQEWSNGTILNEFKLILLLMLRNYRDMSLKDSIELLLGNEACLELYESLGSNVMLILDGYDEMSSSWQADHSLNDVLNSRKLPNMTLVIACRPHACKYLKGFERRIEVLGFDKSQIHQFVKNTLSEDIGLPAEKFIHILETNPYISCLLHIPMCLAMIIEIYQQNTVLPANPNLTELLKLFVICIIERHHIKYPVDVKTCNHEKKQIISEMLPGIPVGAVNHILDLCKLAYNGFFEWQGTMNEDSSLKDPKIVFTQEDLINCGLTTVDGSGFFQTVHVYRVPRSTTTYNFINFTLQEFFCALHICLLPTDDQYRIIREHFEVFPYMFSYFFGLCRPLPSSIFQFICSKLTDLESETARKNVTIFNCAIKCICEASKSNKSEISLLSSFKIDMSYQTLFPYDCLCISYLLHHFKVSQLRLWVCSIGDDGAEQLAKHIAINSVCNLEELDLHWNNFTSDGIEHIVRIVNSNINTLTKVDLGRNPISDKGIELLTNALHCCDAVVHELSIWQCEIFAEGAKCLAKMLEVNKTIKILKMDGNHIGDEGTVAIASVLNKVVLSKLYLNHCGFSYRGAESLVNSLKTNSNNDNLVLYLQRNAITIDGARLMASLASYVKEVRIDEKYMKDAEVQKFMQQQHR